MRYSRFFRSKVVLRQCTDGFQIVNAAFFLKIKETLWHTSFISNIQSVSGKGLSVLNIVYVSGQISLNNKRTRHGVLIQSQQKDISGPSNQGLFRVHVVSNFIFDRIQLSR